MSRSTLTSGVSRLRSRKMSSGRPRRGSPAAASRASTCDRMLIVEIDALLLDDERTVSHLRVDRADVLAEDAEEEQLHRRHGKQADDDRRDADREAIPEHQLHDEVDKRREQADD